MSLTLTTGFFPVETGTAAIDVTLRVFIDNLEDQPAEATVVVSELVDGEKSPILRQEVDVPGGERRIVEVDDVEGVDVEVTVTLPEREFPPGSALVPGVAVVSVFTGDDQSTSLLHWISADDFIRIDENGLRPQVMGARRRG